MKNFYHLLGNTVLTGVTNMTVWFAIIFFAYLQTRAVFATSLLSGIYLAVTAITGIWFGSLVDNNKKKHIMTVSNAASMIFYAIAFLIYTNVDSNTFTQLNSSTLWIFSCIILLGVIAGNIRGIALPTVVTLLVPEKIRDKANGMAGTANGIGFMITSVISGFLVGHSGMYWVLILGIVFNFVTIMDLLSISIPEKKVVHTQPKTAKIDLKKTLAVVVGIPGLLALILFTTFNNFLGGVFMALMDAYGLSLVSVQVWGVMWGFLSCAFILGGIIISKFGLGKNPLRTMFLANILIWAICSVFTVYPSIMLLVGGMFIYLCVVPFIQAAEFTIIQKVVPAERQGRVFGFAQSVEQAASPLTAFAIGPIAQFFFIPWMTDGYGAQLIGSWFGTGPSRGIALVFTLAGIIGLCATVIAMNSKYYRLLSERYLKN
jgi:DHA3 family multidrug efflux protein-like MFS transporter